MLDNLDKQILALLEADARMSKSAIARRLGINKTMVTYRINRLTKNGIITGYQYLIDQSKLGATSFGLLLQFDGLLLAEQQEILRQIQASKKFAWVALTSGTWDAIAVVVAPDIAQFTRLLDEFFGSYGEHIRDYKFYMDYQGLISSHDYLYDEPSATAVA